jgi:hypothetical protein
VFAKKFFLESQRQNLPQVPACATCNSLKSKLENELMIVLPFGGRHADASENLARLAARRVAKNRRMQRALASGSSKVWVRERGLYQRTTAVPLDWSKVERLFALIAKSLAWHHWKVLIGTDCFANAHALHGAAKIEFAKMMVQRAAARVNLDLGRGTFLYQGAQGVDNPCVTVWVFSIYGGLRASGPQSLIAGDMNIGAITGPKRVLQRAELKVRWLRGTRLHSYTD